VPDAGRSESLHLDADTSNRALHRALLERGHDVTRTPNAWMPLDAPDELQLLAATAHGRCVFTFNVRDFSVLARTYPEHAGVLVAHQVEWDVGGLIAALDRFLAEVGSLRGQVRWLNEWRGGPV
jgi:hypothetical protein